MQYWKPACGIVDVLEGAFASLFQWEKRAGWNEICDQMGTMEEEEMNAAMEELGMIQDLLMAHDFYQIDCENRGNRKRI